MNPRARRTVSLMGGLCKALIVVLVSAAPSSALSFPTAQEVIDRVLTTVRHTDLTSVDMEIKFRIGKPVTAPPECVFRGCFIFRQTI